MFTTEWCNGLDKGWNRIWVHNLQRFQCYLQIIIFLSLDTHEIHSTTVTSFIATLNVVIDRTNDLGPTIKFYQTVYPSIVVIGAYIKRDILFNVFLLKWYPFIQEIFAMASFRDD